MRVLFRYVALFLLLPLTAHAETIQGPVEAEVVGVRDGDTLEVIANPWPNILVTYGVRIRGIDTPAAKGNCAAESRWAIKARATLAELAGEQVVLYKIRTGQYARRVVARVTAGSVDLREAMLERGLAQPYKGRAPRPKWCR